MLPVGLLPPVLHTADGRSARRGAIIAQLVGSERAWAPRTSPDDDLSAGRATHAIELGCALHSISHDLDSGAYISGYVEIASRSRVKSVEM